MLLASPSQINRQARLCGCIIHPPLSGELVPLATARRERSSDRQLASAAWLFAVAAMLGKCLEGLRELGLPIPAALGAPPRRAPPRP